MEIVLDILKIACIGYGIVHGIVQFREWIRLEGIKTVLYSVLAYFLLMSILVALMFYDFTLGLVVGSIFGISILILPYALNWYTNRILEKIETIEENAPKSWDCVDLSSVTKQIESI